MIIIAALGLVVVFFQMLLLAGIVEQLKHLTAALVASQTTAHDLSAAYQDAKRMQADGAEMARLLRTQVDVVAQIQARYQAVADGAARH